MGSRVIDSLRAPEEAGGGGGGEREGEEEVQVDFIYMTNEE